MRWAVAVVPILFVFTVLITAAVVESSQETTAQQQTCDPSCTQGEECRLWAGRFPTCIQVCTSPDETCRQEHFRCQPLAKIGGDMEYLCLR